MYLYSRENVHIKRFVIMEVFSNKDGTDDGGKCGICAKQLCPHYAFFTHPLLKQQRHLAYFKKLLCFLLGLGSACNNNNDDNRDN